MAIIEHTSNLNLTQFRGSSIKPAIFEYYNSDMQKIDTAFDTLEDTVITKVDDFEVIVNSFNGRVTTLEGCCEDVNTTLLNYGNRLVSIEAVIATVSTQNIDDLTERVNALENKVNANTTNIDILRTELHEVIERVATAESTLVEHASQLTNHEFRLDTLEACCAEVRETLSAYDARITKNANDISALDARLTRDEGNIAGNAQDITILSGQVAINTADIEDLKQGLAELDPTSQLEVVRQVAVNTENIANLQTSVNAQASNLSAVTNRVASLESDIDALEADNLTLHQEIAQVSGWEQRISDAETLAQSASDDVSTLTTQVNTLDSDLDSLASRVTTNETDIVVLKAKNVEYDSKIATDESALSALTTRVSANEADLTNIHATITADESRLASVENRVSALENQNGSDTLSTTAQTLSGGVNEVNTKATNADSKATQALSTATQASTTAGEASDIAQSASDNATLALTTAQQASIDVGNVASDVSDIETVIPTNASASNQLVTKDDLKSDTVNIDTNGKFKIHKVGNLVFANIDGYVYNTSNPPSIPVGYRPAVRSSFACNAMSSNAPFNCLVGSDGGIRFYKVSTNSDTSASDLLGSGVWYTA